MMDSLDNRLGSRRGVLLTASARAAFVLEVDSNSTSEDPNLAWLNEPIGGELILLRGVFETKRCGIVRYGRKSDDSDLARVSRTSRLSLLIRSMVVAGMSGYEEKPMGLRLGQGGCRSTGRFIILGLKGFRRCA